jgi:Asp-tRNA(Asn)/Glu-tRNA(Gln) amidotransferase A subunit family amidase
LYKKAIKEVQVLKNDIDTVFNNIDLIITPSAPGEALNGIEYTGSALFNTTWSLSGNPCITIPLFRGDQNLPIGCQLVTKFGNDNQLLDYAKSLFEFYLK